MDDPVDADDGAVAGIVEACRSNWTVEALERSGYGTDLACILTCGTPGGRREAVLKATTADLVLPEIARSEPRLLELAGPGAAAGYRNAPEESAATFEAWVSTGDLAVVDADGYVHVEGRKKNMFVSGGENVYPSRVEDAVADHPKVEAAVVVGVPDERLGAVGAAVVDGDHSLTLPELSSFLEGRVADYAVPRSLEVVEALPRSGVGNVDREAVAEMYDGSVTHD